MTAFLDAQPAADREAVADLLQREAIEMAVMLHLDFADEPLFLSNRRIPFTDSKWGYTWGAGAGLLVAMPDASGGAQARNPAQRYRLGLPNEQIDLTDWGAYLTGAVQDRANYVGRTSARYGQLFDPDTGQPVGHPFAFDKGKMDRMSVQFMPAGAIVSLQVEGYLSTASAAAYGTLTYRDQKRRHPTDEGLQFVTEAGKLVVWTQW